MSRRFLNNAVLNVCGALLMLSLLSGCHHANVDAKPTLKSVTLDNREWIPLQKNTHPNEGRDFTIEFVPQGSTVQSWQEMITLQFFATPKHPVPLQQFADQFQANLKKEAPDVQIKTVKQDPQTVELEWESASNKNYEFARATSDPNGIRLFRYTRLNAPIGPAVSVLKSDFDQLQAHLQ